MQTYYLLFAYNFYYPNGGWDDFKKRFTNLEEAKAAGEVLLEDYDKYQVVNAATLDILIEKYKP